MSRHPVLDPLAFHPQIVALLGDVHGDVGRMLTQIEYAYVGGADVVVQLGDLGWDGRGPRAQRFVSQISRALAALSLPCAFIDGNHDAVHLLEELPVAANGLGKVTNALWYVPRGARWTWAGNTWMGLGGAVSVDRNRRRTSPREAISDDDAGRSLAGGPVDVLITHDCPAADEFTIPGLDRPSQWPPDALADSNRHRQVLRSVLDAVRPRELWHGHYHCFYSATIELGRSESRQDWDGLCRVHGLADSSGHPSNQLAFARADGTAIPRAVIEEAVAEARRLAGGDATLEQIAAMSRPAIADSIGTAR